jgi:hypothetical protein
MKDWSLPVALRLFESMVGNLIPFARVISIIVIDRPRLVPLSAEGGGSVLAVLVLFFSGGEILSRCCVLDKRLRKAEIR